MCTYNSYYLSLYDNNNNNNNNDNDDNNNKAHDFGFSIYYDEATIRCLSFDPADLQTIGHRI